MSVEIQDIFAQHIGVYVQSRQIVFHLKDSAPGVDGLYKTGKYKQSSANKAEEPS